MSKNAQPAARQDAASTLETAMAHIGRLERELADARNHPGAQAFNLLKFHAYRVLAGLAPLLSAKKAARFEHLVREWNPDRSLPLPPAAAPPVAAPGRRRGSTRYVDGRVAPDPGKPDVLVVVHAADRTDPPIRALNLAQSLMADYNVTTLCLTGGELVDAFSAVSTSVAIANHMSSRPAHYRRLIARLRRRRNFTFALVHSIHAQAVLEVLAKLGVPAVCLIDEAPAVVADKTAYAQATRWASEVVFAAGALLDGALPYTRDLTPREHIVSPGRCRMPPLPEGDGQNGDGREGGDRRALARRHLRDRLRSEGAAPGRFLVIGAGDVDLRHGVDLFLQTAARVMSAPGGENVDFAWLGEGYDPDRDLGYSVFLRDQMQEAGINARVSFLPATPDIEFACELADALLVTSRQDGLPAIAVEALAQGRPVLCFAGATGLADSLVQAGIGPDCVARYLDAGDMGDKLLTLVASEWRLQRVSLAARSFAGSAFDFADYARQIETLGRHARMRRDHASADIETISSAGRFRADFFAPPGSPAVPERRLVQAYVGQAHAPIGPRRPEPGFNPFIYALSPLSGYEGTVDAYADFLRKGCPAGPWLAPVLAGGVEASADIPAATLASALHVHAYFTDQLPDIAKRLQANRSRPDLFVSVGSEEAAGQAWDILAGYDGRVVAVETVPNIGRDIGPFLTRFGARLVGSYDVVGHVHVKRSRHLDDSGVVQLWSRFLFENLLGGSQGGRMVDLILGAMQADERLGLVHADDPHLLGWTRNLPVAEGLLSRMGHGAPPRAISFPAGTMFWMRAAALKPFVDLGLDWGDYPAEPLGVDGTTLHALERLFGVVPVLEGWRVAVTNIRGVTR